MPNWYTTIVSAKGSEVDLDRIVSTHVVREGEDRVFDMDTVIPVPEAIKNTKAYRHYHSGGSVLWKGDANYGPQEMSMDEYQQSDWYKWASANWSGEMFTKDLHVQREPGKLTLCFTTRWSPPKPVLHKLRELYPAVHFEFRGFDHYNDNQAIAIAA
jgi:Ferredoxin-like domain in Api92-like protein